MQFALGTLGWLDVVVSWDQRHSKTSASHVQFLHSTDGASFVDHGAPFVAGSAGTWRRPAGRSGGAARATGGGHRLRAERVEFGR